MSELSELITNKYEQKMRTLADEHYAEQQGQFGALRGVTIRLTFSTINTLDKMSNFFDMSRQELMAEIIESGISEIIMTIAKNNLHQGKLLPDDIAPEEYNELLEEYRLKVIKELCE